MPDDRAVAEQRADMVRRTSMNPDEGMRKGGKAKMAKGGKAEAFEGSAKDMAQDKKMAKARGMTLKEWEKSSADVKHDTKEGMKKGGHVKGCQCMACGGGVKRMASGGMSTAQDGMKGALRSKPSAMAKGGHVKGCKCMACGGMAKMAKGGDVSGFSPMAPIVRTARSKGISPYRSAGPQLGTGARRYAAKGGKMTEGSPRDEARDMREDKPQAKKAKMSMAKFENSSKDIDKMAKGGKVGMTFGKPLPGTKVSSKKIRATVSTAGANMKKDGMKGQLRAKASGAKASSMMKPLGMTKMASGGKVRGAGIAQRGTKFIGEV
jgi:hypothetical protein